jgi:putative toxin-antitoxin system antitoxin component (TIGR02293 family)
MNNSPLARAGLSEDLFQDQFKYINAINIGVAGTVVKSLIDRMPQQRAFICKALGVTSGNVSRLYKLKALNKTQSEETLDIISVYDAAYHLYDDIDLANELLQTPIPALNNQKPVDLLDSFAGRRLVKEVLNKMKWGELS